MKPLVAQLCLSLCNPKDCTPPDSSVHAISHARVPEWVTIPFARGSSQPRNRTRVSYITGRFFTVWATREAWGCRIQAEVNGEKWSDVNKRQKERELATNHSRRALYVAHFLLVCNWWPHILWLWTASVSISLFLLVRGPMWLGWGSLHRVVQGWRLVLAGMELLLELWVPCKLMQLVDRNQFPAGWDRAPRT